MSMNVRERAAYAAWKSARVEAQEAESPGERRRCGTLLGLAALTVILVGLISLGGAKADSGLPAAEPALSAGSGALCFWH
jgi:hypothetical protein